MTATERPDARRTDRYEAPAYLARYQARRDAGPVTDDAAQAAASGDPLYLRRFRERSGQGTQAQAQAQSQAQSLGLAGGGNAAGQPGLGGHRRRVPGQVHLFRPAQR